VLLLGWVAVLFSRQQTPPESAWDRELFERLRASRRWIGASFGWMALSALDDLFVERLPAGHTWIKTSGALILIALAVILLAGNARSMLADHVKPVRMAWGTLLILLWILPVVGLALLLSLWHMPVLPWVVGWILAPVVLFPLAAASAVWGMRLPWRRVLRLIGVWQWWLAVVFAAVIGVALPSLIDAAMQSGSEPLSQWEIGLKEGVNGLLSVGSWLLLLGWLGVLFGRQQPPPEEVLVAVPVLAGPDEGRRSAVVEIPDENGSGDPGRHT
jgi:hypothetical protein